MKTKNKLLLIIIVLHAAMLCSCGRQESFKVEVNVREDAYQNETIMGAKAPNEDISINNKFENGSIINKQLKQEAQNIAKNQQNEASLINPAYKQNYQKINLKEDWRALKKDFKKSIQTLHQVL